MLLILIFCTALLHFTHARTEHPILIVVSYDGFRYNYFEKNITPHLSRLRSEGTHSEYMTSVFPTKTFPNHFSIATGLYPEVHGVVGNSFYDPKLKKIVSIGPEMFSQNKEVVPIWTWNELIGNGRHSGVMMWPGVEISYQNKTLTYSMKWNKNVDFYTRVDTVISWLTNEQKPANLVMLYFEEPDTHSHLYGPDSQIVYDIIRHLDNVTLYLENQLHENNLTHKANVVHLSDHGMLGVRPSKFVNISKYVEPNTYLIGDTSPCLHIIPKAGYESDVQQQLENAAEKSGHFTVYKKDNFPAKWHFKDNPRIPPILILAEKDYIFQDVAEYVNMYAKKYNYTVTSETRIGVHGYDTDMAEMRPFFMARGPKIRKNFRVDPFTVLDLYDLFCEILEVPLRPNNGTLSTVKMMLRSDGSSIDATSAAFIAGCILMSLILISCIAAVVTLLTNRRHSGVIEAQFTKSSPIERFPQVFHNYAEMQHLLIEEDL